MTLVMAISVAVVMGRLGPDAMVANAFAVDFAAIAALNPEDNANSSDEGAQDSTHARLRDRAIAAIKRRDFAEAESLIRQGRKTRSSRRKDQWTLVEARMEMERGDPAKAGLLAMGVVLLRNNSDETGAALYWAGRAYEEIGRPSMSVRLYEECVSHRSTGDGLAKAARGRIKRLQASSKTP